MAHPKAALNTPKCIRVWLDDADRTRIEAEAIERVAACKMDERTLSTNQRRRAEDCLKLCEDAFDRVVLPVLRRTVKRALEGFQETIDNAARAAGFEPDDFTNADRPEYVEFIRDQGIGAKWHRVPIDKTECAAFQRLPRWLRTAVLGLQYDYHAKMPCLDDWDGTELCACVEAFQNTTPPIFTQKINDIVWKKGGRTLRHVHNTIAHKNLIDFQHSIDTMFHVKFEVMQSALRLFGGTAVELRFLADLRDSMLARAPKAKHTWEDVKQVNNSFFCIDGELYRW